ncbi:MAG: ferritin family protein [Bacteroidota bacterium]
MKEFNNIDDILDFSINNEQEAVDFYTKLANQAKSEAIKKVFTEFAGEEMGHKAKLIDIKLKGSFGGATEKVIDLKIADYIVKTQATPDMSYQDALILAMHREKSAFKLYTALAERAPNADLKKLFLVLAQEESKHKLRFEVEYDEYVMREN